MKGFHNQPNASQLGGKAPEYYIHLRNLLDNSDFTNPVNQRNQENYTVSGYTIDRWKIQESTSVVVKEDHIAIVNSAQSAMGIHQHLGSDVCPVGTPLTVAVSIHPTGNVYCASGVMPETPTDAEVSICRLEYGNFILKLTRETAGNIVYGIYTTSGATMRVRWAALYEGTYTADTLPPYQPKGYTAELLECQRYYYQFKPSNVALSFEGWHYTASQVRVALSLPIPMAIDTDRVPTVQLETSNTLILPEKTVPTSIAVTVVSPNMIMLTFNVTGTQHNLCAVRINAPIIIVAPD